MTGLASRVSAICVSSASSGAPSTSRTKCLPWRTLRTPACPSRPSAPSTACPWGSLISGLRTTSTTTRGTGTRVPGPSAPPVSRRDLHTRPHRGSMVASVQISPAHGSRDGGDHLVRAPEGVRGGEPQHGPARRDEDVLPAQVVDEDLPLPMDGAVELDEEAPVGPREVHSAQEPPAGIGDHVLQHRLGQSG